MANTLSPEVLKDDIAISLAHVLAAANRKARECGIEVPQSLITLSQQSSNDEQVWRINYGPKDYIGRRGGDLIVEVYPKNAEIKRVIRGQ